MENGIITQWLLDYLVHSSILVLLAWGLERTRSFQHPGRRERLWRAVLVVGVLSATLQNVLPNLLQRPDMRPMAVAVEHVAIAIPADVAASTEVVTQPATAAVTWESAATEPRSGIDWSAVGGWFAESWTTLLLTLWISVAGFMLLRLGLSARQGFSLLADRRALTRGRVRALVDQLVAASEGGRSVTLSTSRRLSGPVTLPGGEICLPERALASLSDEQLRAMLAHEVGHAQRRDAEWRIAISAFCAVFCLQPLNLLARARLAQCAELICDDWAAAHTGDARSLAECLVEVASWMHPTPVDTFATPMAEHGSTLRERVARLLGDRFGDTGSAWRERTLMAAVLVALVVLGPGILFGQAMARHDGASVSTSIGGDSFNFHVSEADRDLSAVGHGEIRFADTEDAVVSIEAGGRLEIEDDHRGIERELVLRGGDGDVPELVRFEVDGEDRPLSEAKDWLADVIPELYRMSGIQAEERAARIFRDGGADALLAEIELIRSDFVTRLYLTEHFHLTDGDSDALVAGLELAAERIGSDFEQRGTLTEALRYIDGDREATTALLRAAATIGSDFEAAELLISAYRHMPPGDGVAVAYLDVAETIGSDFELRRALSAALDSDWLVEEQGERILELAGRIGSDFEMAEFLIAFAGLDGLDRDTVRALIRASEDIGSDFEHARTLRAIALDQRLDEGDAVLLLETAGSKIGSDHELATLMTAVRDDLPRSGSVDAAYENAAETLSDFQYGQVMRRRAR